MGFILNMKLNCDSYAPCIRSVKIILHSICTAPVYFHCAPSQRMRYGIFHLGCHFSTQTVLDFGAFRIWGFQIRATHPVTKL